MNTENDVIKFDAAQAEDSVGYLIARARTMLSRAVDESLRDLDITHAQSSVFVMLAMKRCTTAADLSRELLIDSAAMKRTLDKLEKKRLIQRVVNEKDKRLYRLELTEAGKELSAKLPPVYREVLNIGFTGFTEEEIGFLKSLLRKLLANRPLLESKK
ncbi:MarR family winged helix-turn-helix transcriptional regulator [Undibacterium sp. SXout7W]|uniref:MarR family winged helix-turn-helix transcriptional regulator n=1 Tax=Undibacterium sp. SXout7W TaxID=3413049 RepID=UPI003BF3FB9B